MKVLHVVKTVVGATWVLEQVRVLKRLGIDITVALPSADAGLAPEYRRAGAQVVGANLDFPARQPWRIPAVLAACRRMVAEVQPDIIHTHFVGTMLVLRLALGKRSPIPRVFGVTGTLHLENDFFTRLDTHSAGPQDYWIATCKWTQRRYGELGIPAGRVFLGYLGTDVSRYATQRSGNLRAELGIGDDVPLIGMVSLIYPPKWFLGANRGHKGHEDFIAAFARLRAVRPEVRAVLIGGLWGKGQWYEERVKYLASNVGEGRLTCLATRSDLAEIYPDLDLAVVPSHSDGLAYSVVEPLLAEVPVVATDVGGLTDLVKDGETGWLVPPGNLDALVWAMQDALDRPVEAKRRARQGGMLARKMLSLNGTGAAVVDAYRSILSGKTPVERTAGIKVAPTGKSRDVRALGTHF